MLLCPSCCETHVISPPPSSARRANVCLNEWKSRLRPRSPTRGMPARSSDGYRTCLSTYTDDRGVPSSRSKTRLSPPLSAYHPSSSLATGGVRSIVRGSLLFVLVSPIPCVNERET